MKHKKRLLLSKGLFNAYPSRIHAWFRAKGFPGEYSDSMTNYFKSKSGLSSGTPFDHINKTVNGLGFSGTLADQLRGFFTFKTGKQNPVDAENAFWDNTSLDFATAVPFVLVTSASKNAETSANATTAGVNTTGATLIVIATNTAPNTSTVTDSKSNTYTLIRSTAAGDGSLQKLFYCVNPTVGAAHTFTVNGATTFPAIAVLAFSGTISGLDQNNGAATLSPGSVTPAQDSEVLVSGLFTDNITGTPTCDNGFTVQEIKAHAGGVSYGIAIAYKIQTTKAAQAITWTATSTSATATSIATFKQA
jgi:hypothetical protein